ncbi:hypothetical protein HYU16_01050 [Candidatus Woesearchaeota archaeon]|nr:hypothetical protein [Candidatus Woesearchaeota archaeon]
MAKEREGRKDVKNTVSRLVQAVEGSREFLEWRKGNKTAHLSSVFAMGKSARQLSEWLLSYYDGKDDTFTTFSTTGSLMAAKEQAFKKGRAVPELRAGAVKVEVWDCIKTAEDVRAGTYKGEEASTVIAILQPLTPEEISGGSETGSTGGNSSGKESEAKPVWNITYITASFNVINVKIDAEAGTVLSHRISGVMDFMQKDK